MALTEIWTPHNGDPQLDRSVKKDLVGMVMDQGLAPVAQEGLELLRMTAKPLAEYVDVLGAQLDVLSVEGQITASIGIRPEDDTDTKSLWTEKAMRIGAGVAVYGYAKSGFAPTVINREGLQVGSMSAAFDGIPESYVTSLFDDRQLLDLTDYVMEDHTLNTCVGDDLGGIRQLVEIGAGCVRHYLQFSLASS